MALLARHKEQDHVYLSMRWVHHSVLSILALGAVDVNNSKKFLVKTCSSVVKND